MVRIFFWGLMISFLGTLPLGTLNVAAMQIGLQEGLQQAFYFALGCLLVEMIYVRISLVGIDWVRKQHKLMKAMEWLTVLIVGALAVGSFYAATHPDPSQGNPLLQHNLNRFLLGITMSAINPVQIPFWFGWSTILFQKNVLKADASQYNMYILGIGLGTLMGNAVFIFGGQWMKEHVPGSTQYIQWVIGFVFAFTALLQIWKILRKKDAADAVMHIRDEDIPPGTPGHR